MRYKVLLGSVRTDKGVVFAGQFVDLTEKEGIALIREKVVEAVVEQSQVSAPEVKEAVKRTTRPSAKAQKKAEPKKEELLAEPSLDWTLSELEDFAKEKEIEVPADATKEQILEAIKGGDKE
jgi:hypothetical protein